MKVDIKTGLPIEEVKEIKPRKGLDIAPLAREGDILEKEFKSQRGQHFIQLMIEALDGRIMELMREDPQCQTLLKILDDMKVKIMASRSIAEKVVKGSTKV